MRGRVNILLLSTYYVVKNAILADILASTYYVVKNAISGTIIPLYLLCSGKRHFMRLYAYNKGKRHFRHNLYVLFLTASKTPFSPIL